MSDHPEPILLTPGQAAKALGVGRTTVYGLLSTGSLASVRIGRSRRISREAIQAYVVQLERQALRPAASSTPRRLARSDSRMAGLVLQPSHPSAKMATNGGRRRSRAALPTVEALSLPFQAGSDTTQAWCPASGEER